jgi:uncharacterized membrane-anchored protein YhcB (DUF1043 family)
MENDDRHEKFDDSKEKYSSSKKSKSSNKESNSNSVDSNDNSIEKLNEKDSKDTELAVFFRSNKSDKVDSAGKKELKDNTEQEPNLSEEEVHEATIVIIDSLTQEVADELEFAEPNSLNEFEALADAVFLDELIEIAEAEGEITKESIEQAYNEAVVDLSLDETDSLIDNPVVTDDSDDEPDKLGSNQEENSQNTLPIASNPISPSSNQNVTSSPTQPASFTYNNLQVNNYTNKLSAPSKTIETVEIIHGRRSDMLVGAIIGYIIGRRGGRKRTEKKLKPKIDNLEKQVTELHNTIVEKELRIRKLARDNVELSKDVENKTSIAIERRHTKKDIKEKLKRREELSKDPSVERIGKFSLPALKIFHERRLPDGSENSPKRKQVEIMTESELLDKVAGLKIHGLDVATMYRKKRLTLETLRQITKEYLRSGPFEQTFNLELLPDEKEIEQKRQKISSAHSNGFANQVSNENRYNDKKGQISDIEKANKLADALLMTRQKPNTANNNKYIIFGIITGIIVAVLAITMLLLS